MTKNYQFDPVQRIWTKPGTSPLTYSDGDENEEYLFSVITKAKDVSTNSPELASAIKDWPSEYHLSPVRHNLLRPFSIGPSDHILELGCGCGAMTRYLGETGAKVVAMDGSRRRAMIAAERCRDLPNVSVYCDNLIDFQIDDTFNFVTLIGVLEYSNRFISGPDPIHACLKKAGSFLAKDGALVLAIENQLGLKYFNGCDEDHLGIPYFGINGLYRKDDPVTFGRHVLAEKLRQSGLVNQEFFFPFPDYKLPGLILSESGMREKQLNLADLLVNNTGRSYPEFHHRAFAEDLAWRVVVDNHVLADFSNSFLSLARKCDEMPPKANWLAKIYSRGRRRFQYQVESTIAPTEAGNLMVYKRRIFSRVAEHKEWVQHAIEDSQYISGHLLVSMIHKAMAREVGIDELAACFKPWLEYLLTHTAKDKNDEKVLPGNFVDCIPANLITLPAGNLQYFDAEWVCESNIPLSWIVTRGITNSLIGCLENKAISDMTYRQFILYVAEFGGINLSREDFLIADLCEARFYTQCLDDSVGRPRLADLLDQSLSLIQRLKNLGPELNWHHAELERVKNTFSWRMTAPLRAIWNLFKKAANKIR